MKIHTWFVLLLLAGATACPAPAPITPAPSPTVTVSGTVRTVFGAVIPGATVSAVNTSVSAVTDAKGSAALKLETGKTFTLKITKAGFAEAFEVVTVAATAKAGSFTASLLERQPARVLPRIEAGGKAVAKHGVTVELPANALVTASGGAVSGEISVTMTPVNVMTDEIASFPGRFEGIAAGGSRTPLVSYGTVEYELTQNGAEINLAPGKTAQITMPFYASQHPDGSSVKAGDSVPLWSLNEQTGIWTQEGAGIVVVSSMSPSGFALLATVSHFSWWNIDIAPQTATIRVRCLEKLGEFIIAGNCELTGRVLDGNSPRGVADIAFDSQTASPELRIPAATNIRLSVCAIVAKAPDLTLVDACGFVTVNRPTGSSTDVSVQLELQEEISLSLLQPAQNLTTDGTVNLEAVLNSGKPEVVQLVVMDLVSGDRAILKSFTSAPYTFAWDTTSVKQGTYLVGAIAVRGLKNVASNELREVTVDRNNPAPISSFTQSQVLTETAFTYAFDPSASAGQGTQIERLIWDFGDGGLLETSTKEVVQHRFITPGTYTVSLTVEDLDGERTTSTQTVTVTATNPLGTIVFERPGFPLVTRGGTEFTASIVNNPQVTTWEARFSNSHPLAALRGRCVAPINLSSALVRAQSDNCPVVKQPGEKYTFEYRPDSPFKVNPDRPGAALDAYDEPITITASTPLGAFAQLNALLQIPTVPDLPVGGNLATACTELSAGSPATVYRHFKFTAPNDWFALQLTPDQNINLRLLLEGSNGFLSSSSLEYTLNQPAITAPILGAGRRAAVQFGCRSTTGNLNLASTIALSSGDLTLGQQRSVTISAGGNFYLIKNLPANPEVVFDSASFLNVGGTGGLASLIDASGNVTSESGCSSCAFFGIGTRLSLPVAATTQFALLLRPSSSLGGGSSVNLIAALPGLPGSLSVGQTLPVRLPSGLMPALIDLSAPAGSWVIVKNNQNLFIEPKAGNWTRVFPSYNSRQARSWLAAVSDGAVQRIHVSPHTAFSDQNFIPLGLDTTVTMQAPIGNIAPGATVTGTLTAPYDNNPPGLGTGSLEYAHLYTFSATASQRISFTLPAPVSSLKYVVIAPNGNVVRECVAQSTTQTGCTTPFTVPSAGQYGLVVFPATPQTGQTYNFTLNFLP